MGRIALLQNTSFKVEILLLFQIRLLCISKDKLPTSTINHLDRKKLKSDRLDAKRNGKNNPYLSSILYEGLNSIHKKSLVDIHSSIKPYSVSGSG